MRERHGSRGRVVAATIAAGACLVATPAWAGGVRPLQPRGERLLEEGLRRCETFRALRDRLASSDVVVYVDLEDRDPNGATGVEAHLQFSGAAAGSRYVRVWLQPRRGDDRLVALLAHELQHAVELASAPQVLSAAAFRTLYAETGRAGGAGRFCTEAAEQVARRVAGELRVAQNDERPRR